MLFGMNPVFAVLNLTTEELEWLQEHPIVRLAPDPDYAPFEFRNTDGQIEGIAPDTLHMISKILGIRVKTLHSDSWEKSLEMVKNGEADLVTVATPTPEREVFLSFTKPYAIFPDLLIVRQDVKNYPDMRDLSGKTLAGIKGWAINDEVQQEYPDVRFRWLPDVKEALTAVSLGEVDGIFLNRATAGYWVQRLNITNLRNVGETHFTYRLSFSIRKDWPLLRSIMDKALSEISMEERLRIQARWISLPEEKDTLSIQLLWGLLIGVLLILSVVVLSVLHLRLHQSFATSVLGGKESMIIGQHEVRIKFLIELLPWLALFTGLAATFVWHQAAEGDSRETLKVKFNYQAQEISSRVQQRMHTYEQILRAVRGLFAASKSVERDEFHAFVGSLQLEKQYTGIQGVGFSLLVAKEEKDQHVDTIRREGFSNYSIRPPGNRSLYTSIIYLEPFDGRNLRAFGYDMYSENVRRMAMERARDSDMASMSGKVTLVQEEGQRVQAGFLMYVPIYRNGSPHETLEERRINLMGWAYSPFRMDDLMEGILGMHPTDVDMEIFDGDVTQPNTLMYDSDGFLASTKPVTTLYKVIKRMDIAGHTWTIVLSSKPSFESQIDYRRSQMILFGGVLISIFLYGIVWLLVYGRLRASRLAERMTDELRNNQERLALATEAGFIGIWDWDLVHNRLFWDDAMYRLYGIRKEDFGSVYEAWLTLLHPEDKAYVEAEIKAALNGERECAPEFRTVWMDGSVHYLKAASRTISDHQGKKLRMVGINYDLTERKQAEQVLVSARKESEQANRARGDFLANMSHEIRTPMNAIIGMSYLTLQTELTGKQKDYIEKIHKAAKLLLGILNDILDFSKIDANKVELETIPFSLSDVLDNLIDLTTLKSIGKELELLIAVNPLVPKRLEGDPLWLSQILINLVNNATKFTESGEIVVRVEQVMTQEESLVLRFSITDSGIGMTEEQIEKLFQPFSQADSSTTRKYGGSGLGLIISKRLVEIMGGKIWVESRPGQGSTFTFTARFGLLKETEGQVEKKPSRSSDTEVIAAIRGARVLLVEDNEFNQQVATELLEMAHMVVIVAENGQIGVEKIRSETFDIVFMDVQMPVMDGYMATREIRKDTAYADLPIIAMTANAMASDRDKCLGAGMNDHISKPIDPKKLYTILTKWIRPDSARNFSTVTSKVTSKITPVTIASSVPKILFQLSGLDIRAGLSHVDNNVALYLKILSTFVRDQEKVFHTMVSLLEAHELSSLERTAHTLKGIAATIGATGLSEAAKKVEQGANGGMSKEQLRPLLAETSRELEDLLPTIVAALPVRETKFPTMDNGILDLEVLTPLFKQAETLLQNFTPDVELVIAEIEKIVEGSSHQDYLCTLKQLLEDYDYEECLNVLGKWTTDLGIKLRDDFLP